ncbi:hypothetical protein DL765_005156 [Monosporascus sp. GIB2]|nr:hypothetical protein DL765_005156 [Monosporascus sp. GIB2]
MDEQVTRLVDKAWERFQQIPEDRRFCGIPGSGKTTLSQKVATALNARHATLHPETPATETASLAAFVPMDGYHLTRAQLSAMPDPVHAHARRGAEFTFDGAAFLRLVRALRVPLSSETKPVLAPSFDHAIKDPKPDDIAVLPGHRIVVFEGNYVCLDRQPWREAAALMDERWFVDVDFATARRRLVARHVRAGIAADEDEAGRRADENDLLNGEEIVKNRVPVDEVVVTHSLVAMAAVSVVEVETLVSTDEVASSKKRKSQVEEIEVDLSLPEPPSKKAKRLLKKGKPLPVKPASDDEAEDDGVPPSKTTTKDGKEKRSDYGIWIGNLPFYLTRADLFKWLIDNSGGAITEENITRVNLPMIKASGSKGRLKTDGEEQKPQNRGFAYVDFDSKTAHVAAMALTESELGARRVLIKDSKSFEGRPQKESTSTENGPQKDTNGTPAAKNIASKKIYIGNLSFQTTEDDLRAQFDKCGEIEWLKVATFEDSGRCKGYGWVKFKEPGAAEWAVKGFVKLREEIETEDDFREPKEGEDAETEPKEKKFKTRKWFVNRLHGRELKIDYAEDDQTRYKKRFGKDAPEKKARFQKRNPAAPVGDKEDGASSKPPPAKKSYGNAAVASYLTGSVVKPEGKKITFD